MNNQQMMELTTVETGAFEELVKECTRSGSIDQNLYTEYDVKRGLRDSNGNVSLQVLPRYQMYAEARALMVERFLWMENYIIRDIMWLIL